MPVNPAIIHSAERYRFLEGLNGTSTTISQFMNLKQYQEAYTLTNRTLAGLQERLFQCDETDERAAYEKVIKGYTQMKVLILSHIQNQTKSEEVK